MSDNYFFIPAHDAVQLTWMSYDLVALRTSPALGASLHNLEEAYQRCRAAVCRGRYQEPQMGTSPDPTATTQHNTAHNTQM